MDFTDEFRLTRTGGAHSCHSATYSPGSTFLATLHHIHPHHAAPSAGSSRAASDGRHSTLSQGLGSSSSSDGGVGGGRRKEALHDTLVQIRASTTLQIVRTWTLDFAAVNVRWSDDGTMLLLAGRSEFCVLAVDPRLSSRLQSGMDHDGQRAMEGCVLRIKAGQEGMQAGAAHWLGNRTVCVFTTDNLLAILYDVRSGHATVLPAPKVARAFVSPSRSLCAFIVRRETVDMIAVYSLDNRKADEGALEAVATFACRTNDAVGLCWSPDERFLLVWEGVLEYKMQIFSISGHHQATFHVEAATPITTYADGATQSGDAKPKVASGAGHKPHFAAGGLGIRDVKWSPIDHTPGLATRIAIGDFADNLRILETDEWLECNSFDLTKVASSRQTLSAQSWREPIDWLAKTGGRSIVAFDSIALPIALPKLQADLSKLNPKAGISWMEWSSSAAFLAARCESVPTALFIFAPFSSSAKGDTDHHLASVLVFASPITGACWQPSHDELVVVCQTQALFVWRASSSQHQGKQVVEAIPIPIDGFHAVQATFAPNGQTVLLLSDTDSYCCAMDAMEADFQDTNDIQSPSRL